MRRSAWVRVVITLVIVGVLAGVVFVVVGDSSTVKPQLAKLGLPVEEIPAR